MGLMSWLRRKFGNKQTTYDGLPPAPPLPPKINAPLAPRAEPSISSGCGCGLVGQCGRPTDAPSAPAPSNSAGLGLTDLMVAQMIFSGSEHTAQEHRVVMEVPAEAHHTITPEAPAPVVVEHHTVTETAPVIEHHHVDTPVPEQGGYESHTDYESSSSSYDSGSSFSSD